MANIDGKLNFHLNRQGFSLGAHQESSRTKTNLEMARCKRAWFMIRYFAEATSADTLFWAKEAVVTCFEDVDGASFYPSQAFGHSADPRGAMALGHSPNWRSSAYLFFRADRLWKIIFHQSGSTIVGRMAKSFREAATKHLGEALKEETIRSSVWAWASANSALITEVHSGNLKAFYYWIDREIGIPRSSGATEMWSKLFPD